MRRVSMLWLWLWTEAVALAASVLPSRAAYRVERWCIRRQRRPDAEGDTFASVAARRVALARLFRELHASRADHPARPAT